MDDTFIYHIKCELCSKLKRLNKKDPHYVQKVVEELIDFTNRIIDYTNNGRGDKALKCIEVLEELRDEYLCG